MKVSVATDRLTFTPLTDADLPVLHDWLGREHVSRWWGPQRSLEEVIRDYHPAQRCFGGAMFFFIRLDDEPLGFIQGMRPLNITMKAGGWTLMTRAYAGSMCLSPARVTWIMGWAHRR